MDIDRGLDFIISHDMIVCEFCDSELNFPCFLSIKFFIINKIMLVVRDTFSGNFICGSEVQNLNICFQI